MSKGIYQYKDLENDIVVYIGKDSNINKNDRHKVHLRPSVYNKQKINKELQKNPERYEYSVICEYPNLTDEELNWLECMEIMKHKFLNGKRPKFNMTPGGDGSTGYRKPKELFKYSISGKKKFIIHDKNGKTLIRCKYRKRLIPVCEALNKNKITEQEVRSVKGVSGVMEILYNL